MVRGFSGTNWKKDLPKTTVVLNVLDADKDRIKLMLDVYMGEIPEPLLGLLRDIRRNLG